MKNTIPTLRFLLLKFIIVGSAFGQLSDTYYIDQTASGRQLSTTGADILTRLQKRLMPSMMKEFGVQLFLR